MARHLAIVGARAPDTALPAEEERLSSGQLPSHGGLGFKATVLRPRRWLPLVRATLVCGALTAFLGALAWDAYAVALLAFVAAMVLLPEGGPGPDAGASFVPLTRRQPRRARSPSLRRCS